MEDDTWAVVMRKQTSRCSFEILCSWNAGLDPAQIRGFLPWYWSLRDSELSARFRSSLSASHPVFNCGEFRVLPWYWSLHCPSPLGAGPPPSHLLRGRWSYPSPTPATNWWLSRTHRPHRKVPRKLQRPVRV
jgi:hypothetical protein